MPDDMITDFALQYILYFLLFIQYVAYINSLSNISYFMLAFKVHNEKIKQNSKSF